MVVTKFFIDLGQGDGMDVSAQNSRKYTINDILSEIKKAQDWVVFGDTAIQISKIKRIVAK